MHALFTVGFCPSPDEEGQVRKSVVEILPQQNTGFNPAIPPVKPLT
jgi:hypothetical protein